MNGFGFASRCLENWRNWQSNRVIIFDSQIKLLYSCDENQASYPLLTTSVKMSFRNLRPVHKLLVI